MIDDRMLDIMNEMEKESRCEIEDKEAQIRDMNQKYSARFQELEKKLQEKQSIKLTDQIAKKWNIKRSKESKIFKLIEKMEKATNEKAVQCNL